MTDCLLRSARAARSACTLALTVAVSSVAAPAAGQGVTVTLTRDPSRENPRPQSQSPASINRDDYLGNVEITFPLRLSGGFLDYSLEAWVGFSADAQCTKTIERSGANPRCCPVFRETAPGATRILTLGAKDILGNPLCQHASSGDTPQPFFLYFMLVKASDAEADGRAAIWESDFDLVGPPAPSDVSTGVGEKQLIVHWTAQEGDIAGYRVYCEASSDAPEPSQRSTAFTPAQRNAASGEGAAGAGGSGDGGDGGVDGGPTDGGGGNDGGVDGGGGSGGGGGGGGAGGGDTDAGTDAGTTNPECPTSSLRAGVAPDPELEPCGRVENERADEATADDLKDGTLYGIAVAAVDQLGNSGPLSEIACGKPQPVDDFFELYRRAGGKGGGGFCSLDMPRGPPTRSGWLAACALLLVARRRWR